MSASSLPDGLLLLLSIAWLEHTFNKQGLKPEGASPQPLKRHGLRRAKALLCHDQGRGGFRLRMQIDGNCNIIPTTIIASGFKKFDENT